MVFAVGLKAPEESGFKIIGAHTDSPNLRLKPNPVYLKNGYIQLGVEVYGGALLSTWTDRDLSLAGRVILKEGPTRKVSKRYSRTNNQATLVDYGCSVETNYF